MKIFDGRFANRPYKDKSAFPIPSQVSLATGFATTVGRRRSADTSSRGRAALERTDRFTMFMKKIGAAWRPRSFQPRNPII
jgi:hypothetical protein